MMKLDYLRLAMAAAMAATNADGSVHIPSRGDRAKRRFRSGPCEICGKPDVRSGRERGVYRCGAHQPAKGGE